MTFAARQHTQSAVGAAGVQNFGVMLLSGREMDAEARTVSLTTNTDGTFSFTNGMTADVVSTVPTNWYAPTTGAIGTNYRVRYMLQSGAAWDTGLTTGTYYTLTSARTITFTCDVFEDVDAVVVVEITAVGNNTVLAQNTLTIDLMNDN